VGGLGGGIRLLRKPLLFLIIMVIAVVGVMFILNPKFDAEFATVVHVRYKYGDSDISFDIVDSEHMEQLKKLLMGSTYTDMPSCGFSADVSIILSNTNTDRCVTLCLALDGCAWIRIDATDRYIKISDNARAKIDAILAEYGFRFPCI